MRHNVYRQSNIAIIKVESYDQQERLMYDACTRATMHLNQIIFAITTTIDLDVRVSIYPCLPHIRLQIEIDRSVKK